MHKIQENLLKAAGSTNLGELSLRKIGKLIGESSPQKVHHHIAQLQKKGLIRVSKDRKSIERVGGGVIDGSNLVSVPILGAANCGPATFLAEENLEGYLKVSSKLLKEKENIFALSACGVSMNRAIVEGERIEDGDYLIVSTNDKAPVDNNIIVSIIDGAANVKKYYHDKENRRILLLSDSTKNFPPIFIHEDDNFTINGKVIQVIKRPKF